MLKKPTLLLCVIACAAVVACDGDGSGDDGNAGAQATCGNGRVEVGEECDLGADNSDSPGARCTLSCQNETAANALSRCDEDADCTVLVIEGRVVGLPVAQVTVRSGEFSTTVATDVTGAYSVEAEIREPESPLVLTATSDIPIYAPNVFYSSIGTTSRVLELAEDLRVTEGQHPFVNINALSTAFHLATSVNGATLPEWNGADRAFAEWLTGREISSPDIVDLAAAIRFFASAPENTDYGSVTSTTELLGNEDALEALLAQLEELEELEEQRAALLAELVTNATPFVDTDFPMSMLEAEVLSGPIVTNRNLFMASADGSGSRESSLISGALTSTPLTWELVEGRLEYTYTQAGEFRVGESELLEAYAGASQSLLDEIEALELPTGSVPAPLLSIDFVTRRVLLGVGAEFWVQSGTQRYDLAAALDSVGVTAPPATLDVDIDASLQIRLNENARPETTAPLLADQTYAINLYRDTTRRAFGREDEDLDFYFGHTIDFRADGTGTATGPEWESSIELTWSQENEVLTLTTEDGAVHRCVWFWTSNIMDGLRCEIEIEDRTRTVLSRGVLIDPAFDFSGDTLLTGLTGYWQTTIGWVNDRVSAPEELGPRNRFGFLFVEDGSFRRLRFRANPGDEGSLDNTVPTLAIEQTFEQQVTAERTRITSTRDIEFFQFGCDVSDPLCFDWQLRIWTPIAFRDNFLFVLEDQSFPNFDLFGSTYDESTGVYTRDGVEVDPTERFNQIWPRINVYYFDVVPPWPWAAQTDNSCGTSEVPDGRLDALNECQPRLLDREELFELPAPAEEGLAIDLDSDGVDEVVVADADGDVVRFDLQSGAPTAVATVNEECCAVAIVRTRSTGSTDPEFSVALAGATPRLLTCDGSLTCTRFSLPAGPVAAATLDVDSVHTLAVATDANRIQLYSASAGGFVAGADIGVNAVAALAGGDVNNDGIDDLVVGESSGDVVVLAGEAGGTFSELARTALASIPTSLAVVDLGNDDRNELVTLTPDGVFIYPKLTSLGFALPVAQDAFGENLTFGDFNGDGLLDAAAATRFEVQVLPGAMSQGLGAEISHPRGNSDVVTGLVGNFNADSELDYVVLTVDGQLEVLLGAVTD